MNVSSFNDVSLEKVKFRTPKNPNSYGGWCATAYDEDFRPVIVASPPDLSLPFGFEYGGLAVYEEICQTDDPHTSLPTWDTPFYLFVRRFIQLCTAHFDDTRNHFRQQGDPKWGTEEKEMFPIAQHKATPHETGKTYVSNKYSFKAFNKKVAENGKVVDKYEVDIRDEFNSPAKLSPQTGQRGQLLLHLHSWYYDSKLKKFSVRIYVKAIALSKSSDTREDIRSFFDTKQSSWLPASQE